MSFIIVRDSDNLVLGVFKVSLGANKPAGSTEFEEDIPREFFWGSVEIKRTGVNTYIKSTTRIRHTAEIDFHQKIIDDINGAATLAALKTVLKVILRRMKFK